MAELKKAVTVTVSGRNVSFGKNGSQYTERPRKNQGNGTYGCQKIGAGGYS